MNAFDYFFEQTSQLGKNFLVGHESISYIELYQSSLHLADWLKREFGIKNYVFLISPNNLFFIKTYLAILKSGNICLPIDPSIEIENFKTITGMTNPSLVFLTKDLEKRLPVGSFHCFTPDSLPKSTGSATFQNKEDNTKEDDCAEIIFTSGSTGKPKGVMLSHKNLIANTRSILGYLHLTQNDRMLVVLPFYYCYGLSLLHTHLRIGGSITLNNSFIFLGKVIKDILDYNCTGFAGVPSHFQILLRKSDSFKKTAFPALRYVTQAGGGLATAFIDEFKQNFPAVKFYVMYGQTEATARLSYLSPELYETKKGSIGKGIPGVELKVVDEFGNKVNPGETGEIIARGDNIMLGYFDDHDESENTVRNGWLYTGDLGTIDSDGFIYITARKKEIIKVGGKRVSPKEIEIVILQLPGILDCTIEGVRDEILGECIKVNIVLAHNNNKNIAVEEIKQHCSLHLALYKIPTIFEISSRSFIKATGKKFIG